MRQDLQPRRQPAGHYVSICIAEQQQALVKEHARGPHACRPAEPRQNRLGQDRLNQQQQERAPEHRGCVKQPLAGDTHSDPVSHEESSSPLCVNVGEMAYLPIEDYGIIGNLQTIALVGMNGSIDWFCFPHFDSPSVFAAILDERKAGISASVRRTADGIVYKQIYWPETNVLVTRFLSEDGVAEIIDYMPDRRSPRRQGFHGLVRQVKVVRGEMTFRVECFPGVQLRS